MRYMLVGCDKDGESIRFMDEDMLKTYLHEIMDMLVHGWLDSFKCEDDTISIVFEDLSSAEIYKLAKW